MKNMVVYVHGKGGSTVEAEHYKALFPDSEVVGFDYQSQTPWEAKEEFPRFFSEQRKHCDSLTLIANSIGAFFSLSSLDEALVDRACFISPVVDMEKLIGDMMQWANVTERELAEKEEIPRTSAKRFRGRISAMCGRTPSTGACPPGYCTALRTI